MLLVVERLPPAAAHGDVPGGQLPAIIALEPLAGSPDRILADPCWVEAADAHTQIADSGVVGMARVST
ncbi:MAG TPA: hypothetical protein VN969_19415 [Streptosporangiaceae bacterium]|nr:hypothetical protein [Streptosporangiaceae bacterium]